MLKEILNNPYRILGVYSNSPKKEQIANKGKMQAFLRVKKSMPFKLDLQGILPDIQRTQELVDYADSELSLSVGQIKHAQFWFINKTPIDGIAFNHLIDGDIDSAIAFWRKSINFSSLQNLFVCYLIKGDYQSAITSCVIPLYSQYLKEFISTIDENSTISKNTLIEAVIDTLSGEGIDLYNITDRINDETWRTLIESKKIDPLISKLNNHVSEAKASKDKGPSARLNAGNKLKIASKPLLSTLKNILSINDTIYQIIADKVAQQVLQCSIDYYNDTDDIDSPAKALPLCDYAISIAVGNAAKQRCEQNRDIIKEAYENMPPAEVAQEATEINNLLSWYSKQKRTSKNGLELLKKAQKPIISIKEKVGKKNSYYLETSSLIGNAALSYVIDEVNDAQKEDKPNPLEGLFGSSSAYSLYGDLLGGQERRRQRALRIKAALHDAWETIVHIDLLDKTDDFDKNRYQPNRKSLYSIINSVKGFSYSDDNYILTGCARGVSAYKKFFWCDSEFYEECTNKRMLQGYLQRFPNGIHAEEAKQKIEEIEAHEKKVIKYIIITAIIAIILFIIIIAANGKGNTSSITGSSSNYNTSISNNTEILDQTDISGSSNFSDITNSSNNNGFSDLDTNDYYADDDEDDDADYDDDNDEGYDDDDIDIDNDLDFDDNYDSNDF